MALVSYILFGLFLVILWNGVKLAEGRFKLSTGILYYILFYGFVATVWFSRALVNMVLSKGTKWR